MRNHDIGLACAGGVVEGAFYEIGVLCALEEAVAGLDTTALGAYVGVSAGAIVTSCLANGIGPHALSRAAIGADEQLRFDPETVFAPALREYGSRAASLPGRVAGALGRYLARPADISPLGALMGLGASLPVGVFDNRPLERYLAGIFTSGGRTNDFRELEAKLRVMAVRLDTAELVAFGSDDAPQVPISRAVQASAALPILYPPVEIGGEHYIDGVALRTLNASQALAEGVGLLFCINPIVPVDLRAAGGSRSLVESGLPAVLSQTFRTIIHSRMLAGFRAYEHLYPDADLILIEPSRLDHSMFFTNIFSFSNRRRVCEHAYQSTREFLLREAERLEPKLARHGLGLRRDVLRDPSRALYGGGEPVRARSGAQGTLDRLDRALVRLDQLVD
jgi:NTE family protein